MDLSYLELEGQGRGIIMEVTRPLLLRLFYKVKWPITPNIFTASVCIKCTQNNCQIIAVNFLYFSCFFKNQNYLIIDAFRHF